MKCLGLIGGSSASATALLLDHLREETEDRLGRGHAPEFFSYCLDPQEIRRYLRNDEWGQLAERLIPAVRSLAQAGATAMVLGSSALQVLGGQLAEQSGLPVFGMIEPVAEEARRQNLRCLALVGTRCKAEEETWRQQLLRADIELALPLRADRTLVTAIIDEELSQGHCREPSRVDLMRLLVSLRGQGAQGIVFTQPDLSLLIEAVDFRLPILSAPRLCARQAIRWVVPAQDPCPEAAR